MRILQAKSNLTQRDIAHQLDMSTSGLNYFLKGLLAKGLVMVGNFSHSKNKFGYIYVLTPQGLATKVALAGQFLQRKLTEYQALQTEIVALRAEALPDVTDSVYLATYLEATPK